MSRGAVSMIEAAYTWEPDEEAWLSSLAEASRGYDLGPGIALGIVALGEHPSLHSIVGTSHAAESLRPIANFIERLPPSLGRAFFAPTEFAGNAAWRMRRLAKKRNAFRAQLPPMWAVVSGDARREAMFIGFLGSQPSFQPDLAFPHRDRKVLGFVGAHLSAALRLRRALRPAPDAPHVEAVLDSSGRVHDARGRAMSRETRESLSLAVVQSERARGALRTADEAEAASLWRALVDGRWSIVEVIESDGKRMLLACANPPDGADRSIAAALDADERSLVWLAALGHSHKYLAYELGVNVSTIVRRLDRIMQKLGIASRRELLRKLATQPLPHVQVAPEGSRGRPRGS